MNDNGIIQGLWVGKTLPMMQQLSIRSFLSLGYAYHLYAYEDIIGLPPGAELKDAGRVLSPSLVQPNPSENTYATPFSDMFRYRLLLESGGWWADTDIICLRPFLFDRDTVFSSEHRMSGGVAREVPTITVMKAPRGADFLGRLYDSCRKMTKANLDWNATGSTLLGEVLEEFALHEKVARARTFCPLPMYVYRQVLDPEIQFVFERATHAIHLWHEKWRRARLNVDGEFDRGCFYERLKAYLLHSDGPKPLVPFTLE